jgi:hypothetical protein
VDIASRIASKQTFSAPDKHHDQQENVPQYRLRRIAFVISLFAGI